MRRPSLQSWPHLLRGLMSSTTAALRPGRRPSPSSGKGRCWSPAIPGPCTQGLHFRCRWWSCGGVRRQLWAWGLGCPIPIPCNLNLKGRSECGLAAVWATDVGIRFAALSGFPLSGWLPPSMQSSNEQRLELSGLLRGHLPGEDQAQLAAAQGAFEPALFFGSFWNQFRNANGCSQLVHSDKRIHGFV